MEKTTGQKWEISLTPLVLLTSLVLLAFVALFKYYSSIEPSAAQQRIDIFMSSETQEIKLVDLFPWSWRYICFTGDYATIDSFKSAMGRPVSLSERFIWFLQGSGAENTDNLIFEDAEGVIVVYQYDFLAKPPFYLPTAMALRGKCVGRSDEVGIARRFSGSTKFGNLEIVNK